jgi:hypothetical protein
MKEAEDFGVKKRILIPESDSGNLRLSAFICG